MGSKSVIVKDLIRKILKEEIDSDWDWAEEASSTILGEELEEVIRNNNLTQIPNHIKHVEGYLDLGNTKIESLGNLQSVGGSLDLYNTKIKSLGNLQSVGSYLNLSKTPISEKYSEQEIRNMVNVGTIYM